MMEKDYRDLADKFHRREDLICKIFDGVSEWVNGCYKCMYDKEFLFTLAIMENEALQSFLDKEGWKTHFKKT